MAGEIEVQVKDKFCLTIDEASEYFNIGEKKTRKLVAENMDSGFVIQNGVKVLIKRKRFEVFLDDYRPSDLSLMIKAFAIRA